MHFTPETALDLLEGRLSKDQESFWNQHLQVCSGCKQDVDRWRQIGIDLKRSHLRSAPDLDLERASQIFQPQPGAAGSRLRRVLASVIFDSFFEPALAGARGAATAARQMVLRTEEFDIHIKIWGDGENRQLLGQLLPRSGENFVHAARFHLLRNGESLGTTGERLGTTAIDEMGEFHFTDVPDVDLCLQIDLPHLTVVGELKTNDAGSL